MLVIAGAGLSLATISDGFVYLTLQRRLDLNTGLFPLLYVATALVYLVLAVPVGRLADRVGRVPFFLGGYAVLLGVYPTLLLPGGGPAYPDRLPGLARRLGRGNRWCVDGGHEHHVARPPAGERPGDGDHRDQPGAAAGLGPFGALWTVGGVELAVTIFLTGLLVAIGLSWIGLGRRGRGDRSSRR